MRMSKMYWVKGKINNQDFSGRFDSKRKIVKTILDKLGLKDESSLQFKKVDGENKWFIYLAEPKDGTYFAVTELKTKPDNELNDSVNER